MLRKYILNRIDKQNDFSKNHNIDNIVFKNEDLNISKNAPVVVAGKKGSGKTSFISGFIDGCIENKIFNNILYKFY